MSRVIPASVGALFVVGARVSFAVDSAQLVQNKKHVIEFYGQATKQKDFEPATPCFGSHDIQHNLGARRHRRVQSISHVPQGEISRGPQ
jgi:hypothetical protein